MDSIQRRRQLTTFGNAPLWLFSVRSMIGSAWHRLHTAFCLTNVDICFLRASFSHQFMHVWHTVQMQLQVQSASPPFGMPMATALSFKASHSLARYFVFAPSPFEFMFMIWPENSGLRSGAPIGLANHLALDRLQ